MRIRNAVARARSRPGRRHAVGLRLASGRLAGGGLAGGRPADRRLAGILAASILVTVAVAGCGSATTTPTLTAGQSAASPTASAATPTPEASATDPGGTPLDSPSPSAGPASPAPGGAGCTGSVGNRDFFSSVAASVDWTVYCAVLPDGWFIESGNYRLRSQGQMRVAYRGPDGAHLVLSEGAFCTDANGCVPNGQANGSATFGDLDGTMYNLDGGGLAIVVDQGAAISWLAIGGNLDQPTFQELVAELHRVD